MPQVHLGIAGPNAYYVMWLTGYNVVRLLQSCRRLCHLKYSAFSISAHVFILARFSAQGHSMASVHGHTCRRPGQARLGH
jgi:hypothetical protein